MSVTLFLGGVRAGKSGRAVALAREIANDAPVLFVATAQAFDDEMRHRINNHKLERPAHWLTIEEPLNPADGIADALMGAAAHAPVVIVDCLTLWVSNLLLSFDVHEPSEARIASIVGAFVTTLTDNNTFERNDETHERHFIIVSNEVGLGIVPPTPLGRQYRDALGRANQLVAAAANDVVLMVAGLELTLKTSRR